MADAPPATPPATPPAEPDPNETRIRALIADEFDKGWERLVERQSKKRTGDTPPAKSQGKTLGDLWNEFWGKVTDDANG